MISATSSAERCSANSDPTAAPMLTDPIRSMTTPARASSSMTPMCASPRAPPPDSTTPTDTPASRRAARATPSADPCAQDVHSAGSQNVEPACDVRLDARACLEGEVATPQVLQAIDPGAAHRLGSRGAIDAVRLPDAVARPRLRRAAATGRRATPTGCRAPCGRVPRSAAPRARRRGSPARSGGARASSPSASASTGAPSCRATTAMVRG